MLEVGNGMSEAEDRAHFSMWAMLAAPLIAGNDLTRMLPATRAILINREVIAVDQDPLGIQGFRHSAAGDLEIWFKPLEGGDWAMCVLNRSASRQRLELVWQELAVDDALADRQTLFKARLYRVRDLWAGADLGTTRRPLEAEIAGHDVLMVRLVRVLDAND
jgi:alpha-galactosidase